MSRRTKSYLVIALFALCYVTLGKAPRLPETRGLATLEMSQREGEARFGADA